MKESEQVRELKAERDELQARVHGLEAQAVAMREALEASDHFESLTRAVEHALANRDPQLAGAYRLESERARGEAQRLRTLALATDAGQGAFERLLRLDQEVRQLRQYLGAVARQSGGTVRVSRATMEALPPDLELDIYSSDVMHTEIVIAVAEKGDS